MTLETRRSIGLLSSLAQYKLFRMHLDLVYRDVMP